MNQSILIAVCQVNLTNSVNLSCDMAVSDTNWSHQNGLID